MTSEMCGICGRPASQPYRHSSPDGQYREGCVAKAHDAYADDWHRRQVAAFKKQGHKRS